MNNIKILGRLTNAPEHKTATNGRSYAFFTVATPRQNNRDEADFIRCVAFDKLADAIAQHCGKGRQVLLDGRLEVSVNDNGNDKPTFFHTVIAHHVDFLHDPHRQPAA